jgi:hypothetical protein
VCSRCCSRRRSLFLSISYNVTQRTRDGRARALGARHRGVVLACHATGAAARRSESLGGVLAYVAPVASSRCCSDYRRGIRLVRIRDPRDLLAVAWRASSRRQAASVVPASLRSE